MNTKLSDTMRALRLYGHDGEPGASLRLDRLPVPQPGPGEVLVRIAAAPINPSDLMVLQGRYGLIKPLPVVPGLEGSGVVVASGPGWERLLRGRRVACTAPDTGDGTWAEYMLTRANLCFPLLPGVSTLRAAMLLVNPGTAWALVEIAQRAGHRALVQTAAASAVGGMVLRLCRRRGLPLVNIVRRPAQVELLRAQGAEIVLDSSTPAFAEQLRTLCHDLNATIAFDAVGGELTGQLLKAMPRHSRVLVYGALASQPVSVDPGQFIFRDQRVEGFWLASWFRERSPLALLRTAVGIQAALGRDLRTEVRAALPLEQVQRALTLYTRHMTAGKVLLMPGLGTR